MAAESGWAGSVVAPVQGATTVPGGLLHPTLARHSAELIEMNESNFFEISS